MRAAPLCAVLALALTGCLEIEEALTVHADGSGKLLLRMAIRKATLQRIEEYSQAQGMPAGTMTDSLTNPAKFFEGSRGFTAVRPERRNDDGEWIRASATAYFTDVGQVQLPSVREGGGTSALGRLSPGSLTMDHRLSAYQETFDKSLRQKAAKRGVGPEFLKATLEELKPLLRDLRIQVSVTAPADLTEADGFLRKDGPKASSDVGPEFLYSLIGEPDGEDAKRYRALRARSEARVAWTAAAAPAGAPASFLEELAAARGSARPSATSPPPEKARGLGDDASQFTDDEVDRLFIDAQLKVARGQIQRGDKIKARETLQGILKDFPKAKAAQEAKKLLDGLK